MPLYIWEDKVSEKKIEILRSFDKYDDAPTHQEMLGAGLTEDEVEAAKLRKVIGTGIRVTRGPSWQGSKGYWARREEW